MQKFLRFLLFFGLVGTSAFAQGRIGDVVVDVDKNTIPVRVTANSTELQNLALQAFRSHGRYKLVASGFVYDIRFSAVTGTQVRVDITQGSGAAPVASQTVNGSSARAALLRAADVAVERTNGVGLRGFFTARLAFVVQGGPKFEEVHLSDLFLGELKRLTSDRSHVITPRWSPDGTRLLYTSYFKNGFPDIFQHDLRTYERTSFVSLRGSNLGARYSPNGQQVAMVLSGEGATNIYVAPISGRPIARRTQSQEAKASPVWSPDGSRLVFAMEPGPQLYVMPSAGGGAQRLATGFTYAAEPDWSRTHPNKIACTVRTSGRYQIAVYDFSQGRATKVSEAPFDGIEPCWLADGRHLVYTARDRNTSVLCILDTETGKSTAISSGLPNSMQANVWTP